MLVKTAIRCNKPDDDDDWFDYSDCSGYGS